MRLTPGLLILADDMNVLIQSWKKILKMGIKGISWHMQIYSRADVIEKEIAAFEARESEHPDLCRCFDWLDIFVVPA